MWWCEPYLDFLLLFVLFLPALGEEFFLFYTKQLVLQAGNEETDANVKLQKLLYLLCKTLPLLRRIQQEQKSELDVECCLRGIVI